MKTTRLTFPSLDNTDLAARLDSPQHPPKAYILFAHCFTCGKDLKSIVTISRALAESGFAVLRFDFTGLGESQGDFSESNFSSNIEDIIAAANHLRQTHQPPQVLIGHSLGGAAVLAAARQIPEIKVVSTIATPSSTFDIADKLDSQLPDLDSLGEAKLVLAGREFHIKKQLVDDLRSYEMKDIIHQLQLPLLIFHSPADETVSIDHARRIFEVARHPKSFISLDTAGHLLFDTRHARMVANILAAWVDRYI